MSEEKKNLNKKEMTDEELNMVAGGSDDSHPYVVKMCAVAITNDFSYFNGSPFSDINTHLNACVKASTGLEEGDVFYISRSKQYYLVAKVLDSFSDTTLDKYDILIPPQRGTNGKYVEVTMYFAKWY